MKHILELLVSSVIILTSYLFVVYVLNKFIKNREIVIGCSVIALPQTIFIGLSLGIYMHVIY